MSIMLLAGCFTILLIAAGMAAAITVCNERERRKRILSVIKGEAGKKPSSQQNNVRRNEITNKLHTQEKRKEFSAQLVRAGISITSRQFIVFSFLFAALMTGISWIMGLNLFVRIMIFMTAFFGIPRFIVKKCIQKRQKKFLEEFADALEAMVRLLKAGMPITEAISMSAREFTGPLGEEMLYIYEAQRVGVPLPEAALAAAQRMPVTEMQMFATGVAIQAQTGSSLSEVLKNMAAMIRARYRLKRKVQALSAEAKASAMIIGSLPFLVGAGMYFINPDYILTLFHTLAGRVMLVGSALWMSAGIFIMKTMIDFKV